MTKQTRKFNGKVYHYRGNYSSKSAAKSEASYYRKKGQHARVTASKTKKHGTRHNVWVV